MTEGPWANLISPLIVMDGHIRSEQVKEFATDMGHTANVEQALYEAGVVTCKVIADKLAIARAQKTRLHKKSA